MIKKGVKEILAFFDLDSGPKAVEALIEVVPYVGAVYAILGRRLSLEKNPETGATTPTLAKISLAERALYIVGEFLVSGHAMRGVKNSVIKAGLKKTSAELAKQGGKKSTAVLVTRAQRNVEENSSK